MSPPYYPPPPPYTEGLCGIMKNADVTSIRNSHLSINWERTIQQKNVNNQFEFLTNSIENICSNYCPHRRVECRHKDAHLDDQRNKM